MNACQLSFMHPASAHQHRGESIGMNSVCGASCGGKRGGGVAQRNAALASRTAAAARSIMAEMKRCM
jgi:hypothetical protein